MSRLEKLSFFATPRPSGLHTAIIAVQQDGEDVVLTINATNGEATFNVTAAEAQEIIDTLQTQLGGAQFESDGGRGDGPANEQE
jgi:hypothetical protein